MFLIMNTNLRLKIRMPDRQKKVGLFSAQKNSPTFFIEVRLLLNGL